MPHFPLSAALASALLASSPSASANMFKPDPLTTTAGQAIHSRTDWETVRRPELLELFREHVYGRNAVERPENLRIERDGEAEPVFDGTALRQRARIGYEGPGGAGEIRATLYLPAKDKPKACFVLIVNRSPRIISEAETAPREFWPVRDILARGYATVAFHYGDVATDKPDAAFGSGVFKAFGPSPDSRAPDAWGAVAAWAWGASRVIDFLETEPRLQNVPVAVAGHSRGGKTALWCGAQDRRVALAISNNSGTTGAAMARTSKGETVTRINTVFPHWFALNYRNFNERPEALPVDQHLLVALMAPRLVYVASATEDWNAYPPAEFDSCLGASPVFELYKKRGVSCGNLPEPDQACHEGSIGYHLRTGEHDLKKTDWSQFMNFADRHLK